MCNPLITRNSPVSQAAGRPDWPARPGCVVWVRMAPALLLAAIASLSWASPQADALAVQQAAAGQLQGLTEQFRRTLDASLLQAPLQRIAADLARSSQVLRDLGDRAGLAVGLARQADVARMLDQPARCAALYADAAAMAAQAVLPMDEAEALTGKAKCELAQGRLDHAVADAERAVPAARAIGHAQALSGAYGVLTEVAIHRQDLAAAAAHSQQELAAAGDAPDKMAQYAALVRRAYLHSAELRACNPAADVLPCLLALKAGLADHEAARRVAVSLQYAAMVASLDRLLAHNAMLLEALEKQVL